MTTNYQDIVNARRLIDGPRNDLMMVSPLKHPWAKEYYDQMCANTWFPAEVDLSKEKQGYAELTEAERNMYDKALAFLSNLDGIQFNNLSGNISPVVTSPEVCMGLSRQSFEEVNHVNSYATLIETVSLNPMDVYMTFERDGILSAKNEYIMRQSRILKEEYSAPNFARAVVANIILEGLYFYSGFLSFHVLARRGKMLGSDNMIKFIQKDEVCHLHFFAAIFKALKQERPELFDDQFYKDATELFKTAAELETKWGQYIIKGGVLGLTDQIVADYIKVRANTCAGLIGMEPIYPGVKHPCEWVEDFAKINGRETNFFEDKVSSYQVGALEW